MPGRRSSDDSFTADRFGEEEVNRIRIALGRIARRVDRHSSEEGMTRTEFSVLATIARRGPLGVRELAEIEGLNPTMLSRILGKLDDRGLVDRTADVNDKRAVRVSTTAVGKALHRRLKAKRSALFAEQLNLLTPEHTDQLLVALPALEELADHLVRLPTPAVVEPAGAAR